MVSQRDGGGTAFGVELRHFVQRGLRAGSRAPQALFATLVATLVDDFALQS